MSDKINGTNLTYKMLTAAMKKAVERRLFPKNVDTETYLENWETMILCIQAAIDATEGES